MVSERKKPNPYLIDDATAPLTPAEIKKLRPADEVLAEQGVGFTRKPGRPRTINPKQQVTLRLDKDILDHFKNGGPGWQTRVNETLRNAVSGRFQTGNSRDGRKSAPQKRQA